MERLVEKLRNLNKTISTMESCTGGSLVNSITNVEGASDVIKFSAITYSNEFKIKMGVSKNTIDKYTVYSLEVAKEMSKQISNFTDSDYGIGITGKLNRIDKNNLKGENNLVFISIYSKNINDFVTITMEVNNKTRKQNKDMIIDIIIDNLLKIIN